MTDVRFDAQIFDAQVRGGISRYFVELMRQFERDPQLGIVPSTPFRRARNEHLAEAYPGRYVTGPPPGRIRGRIDRAFRPALPHADVVHFTFYDPAYLADAGDLPTVSTVHDMIPELLPGEFPNGNPHHAKREFVERSTAVICVSEATRRDLLAVYGPQRAEISVVPLGVDPSFATRAGADAPALPDDFVLFVGHRGGYKDFSVLLEALASGAAGSADLVCVGGGQFSAAETESIRASSLEGRVHRVDVSDDELPAVYRSARCLVYPSRHEGFGLPILEAFSAGCPVVAAGTDVFREVAGDAAAFFDPGEPQALVEQLGTVLGDAPLRERLVATGRTRAADFTWQRTAALTAEVYRRAAESAIR